MAYGAGFCVLETSDGALHCHGCAQRIQYEGVQLVRKKRGRAHLGSQQLKRLPPSVSLRLNSAAATEPLPALYDSPRAARRIHQVSCGISHCLALAAASHNDASDCDSIFAWGIGTYGQLGLGNQQVADILTPVHLSPELSRALSTADASPPAVVRCGPFSSYVFVQHTSAVWHWGLLPSVPSNARAERFVCQGVPVLFPLLPLDIQVADVAVGLEHVAVLSTTGKVFTWGVGYQGQLGLGPDRLDVVQDRAQPVEFASQHDRVEIVAIASGWHHTLALASDNSVFAWGSNRLGACGATTRFHDYFVPVRVPIAATKNTDDKLHVEISCCANTSALSVRSCGSGNALVAAYGWGVCASNVAVLTPIEVPGVRYHDSLVSCSAGMGALHWVYQTDLTRYAPHRVQQPVLLQLDALQSAATCRNLQIGGVVSLRLTNVRASSRDSTRAELDEAEEPLDMRQLTLSRTTSRDGNATDHEIIETIRSASVSDASSLTLKLRAVAPGAAKILVSYAGRVALGCPLEVGVAPTRTKPSIVNHSLAGASTHASAVRAISVVEANTAVQLADLAWTPVTVKHVRMCASDTLVLLVDAPLPITASNVRVLLKLCSSDASASVRIVSTLAHSTHVSPSTAALVAVCIAIEFRAIGEYAIVLDASDGHTTTLLEVVCTANPSARLSALQTNAPFVKRHLARALATDTPASASSPSKRTAASAHARFSGFISAMLENPSLRNAVANSPLVSSADMELARSWDFDCEQASRDVLCSDNQSNDQFVLWRTLLRQTLEDASTRSKPLQREDASHESRSTPDLSSARYGSGGQSFGLWDVAPRWTLSDPAAVQWSLASVLSQCSPTRKCEAQERATLDNYDDHTLEDQRPAASRIGLRVDQDPSEFFVHGSRARCESSTASLWDAASSNEICQEHVSAWRDQHSELFYTLQASDAPSFFVHIYGHESHHFQETARASRLAQRKMQLHRFLWTLLDNQHCCDIDDLFQRFLPSSATTHADQIDHIRLRDFASTLERLGCPVALSKQEWLALFREIQCLAPAPSVPKSSSTLVTRSVFKTFLIDPFHEVGRFRLLAAHVWSTNLLC